MRINKPKSPVKSAQKIKAKRELKESLKKRKTTKKESWPNAGQVRVVKSGKKTVVIKNRFNDVYVKILKRDPINHLVNLRNKKPKLLVLGPGNGQDIFLLHNELQKQNIKPQIDVLGIQKTVEPVLLEKGIVQKDYSMGLALEEIASNSKNKLTKRLKGRYDMVVAASSVGLHTLHPAFNVFSVSAMLNKGGVAYIEVPSKKTIISKGNFGIPQKHLKRVNAQLDNMQKYVGKFLESYGGSGFSKQFIFTEINHIENRPGTSKNTDSRTIRYIKVERK